MYIWLQLFYLHKLKKKIQFILIRVVRRISANFLFNRGRRRDHALSKSSVLNPNLSANAS